MQITVETLTDKKQTVKKLNYLIDRYYRDMQNIFLKRNGKTVSIIDISPGQFFDFIKAIPYHRDEKPIEILVRPGILLRFRNIGMDCKKKSILCGSYFRNKKIKFRFLGISQRADRKIHHIFPQVKKNGTWINYDCTYPDNKIGEHKQFTKVVIL
jgi:hypothetical protein